MSWQTVYCRCINPACPLLHPVMVLSGSAHTSRNHLYPGVVMASGSHPRTGSTAVSSSSISSREQHQIPSTSASIDYNRGQGRSGVNTLMRPTDSISDRSRTVSTNGHRSQTRAENNTHHAPQPPPQTRDITQATQALSNLNLGPSSSSFPISNDDLPIIATRFINHVLNTSSRSITSFIRCIIRRVQLTPYTIVASLLLIQKLKAMYPIIKTTTFSNSPKQLFMAAVLAAYKANMEDLHYHNNQWAQATEGVFLTREINQMEREFCRYLDWEFQMTTPMILTFAQMLMADFSHDGPYPTYEEDLLKKWKKAASRSSKKSKRSGSMPPKVVSGGSAAITQRDLERGRAVVDTFVREGFRR